MEIMKNKDVIDNELVDVYHAEDSIFNNCMNDFEEFPSYITGHDDIEEYYPTKHMKENYKNLILDSVRKRKNKGLINMEHHSRLTRYLFRRDYAYITILVEAMLNHSYSILEQFHQKRSYMPMRPCFSIQHFSIPKKNLQW